ncbi:DNA-binding domain-containing protein, AraC-type [Opitutaceae bacterium TAV1]|nr:DNA-binding domain-containing protein, AraC-type [Opitutaceae bacterium TAV1]
MRGCRCRAGFTRSLVTLCGIARVEWPGRQFLLETGVALHLAGGETARLAAAEQGRCVVAEVLFEGGRPAEYATYLNSNYGTGFPAANQKELAACLRTFARRAKRDGAREGGGGKEGAARLAFRWFLMTHRNARKRRDNLGGFLKGGREELARVASEHGFSLAVLAQHFGCSPSHLASQLQHVWQQPAAALLREARWDCALRLMETTGLHLRDIAEKCSYASVPAFHAAFKKRFGLSPGAFRAQPAPARTAVSAMKCKRPQRSGQQATPAPVRVPVATTPAPVTESASATSMTRITSPAVVPEAPYYHFDGGEVDYPFKKPFRLAIQTISNAMQWGLTLEGSGVFEVGGHHITVGPGMAIMFPQPINATWVSLDEKPWHRVWIKMRGAWAIQTMERFIEQHGWLVSIPLRSKPVALARKWVSFWHQESGRLSFDGCEAAFEWFLSWRDLVESGRVTPLAAPNMRQFSSRQFFRQIKSITSYAREVGYSRSHLSRKLKYQWTETPQPGTFLRRQKLAEAALDLRTTSLSVEEIARRAHYAHTSTFIHAFSREHGASPLQYRLHAQRQQ